MMVCWLSETVVAATNVNLVTLPQSFGTNQMN
jgi:hypothetical protein